MYGVLVGVVRCIFRFYCGWLVGCCVGLYLVFCGVYCCCRRFGLLS